MTSPGPAKLRQPYDAPRRELAAVAGYPADRGPATLYVALPGLLETAHALPERRLGYPSAPTSPHLSVDIEVGLRCAEDPFLGRCWLGEQLKAVVSGIQGKVARGVPKLCIQPC